jgi:hypothetical protein
MANRKAHNKYTPTSDQIAVAQYMHAAGLAKEEICIQLDIAYATFQKAIEPHLLSKTKLYKGKKKAKEVYEPTEKDIQLATYMKMTGIDELTIAKTLNISKGTFNKTLKPNLDTSISRVKGLVASKLLTHIKNGSVPATIFFLKAQCGWSDRDSQSVSVSARQGEGGEGKGNEGLNVSVTFGSPPELDTSIPVSEDAEL